MHSLEEKKELVLDNYSKSFDLEVAMMKVGLDADEKKLMQNDESFMYRVRYADATVREEIIGKMTTAMRDDDIRVGVKAAIDLGNLIWRDKFKAKEDDGKNHQVPDSIILVGKGPKA